MDNLNYNNESIIDQETNKITVYINDNRIAPLIGKEGKTKKKLEKKFKSKLNVDSKNGKVEIESKNALYSYVLKNIVIAINYGHNPENAMLLEDENYVFDLISISDYVKKDKIKKVLGRVIGQNGIVRKMVYEITRCYLVVDENNVSFIGPYENAHLLREGLIMLIKGAPHKAFYSYLERNRTLF